MESMLPNFHYDEFVKIQLWPWKPFFSFKTWLNDFREHRARQSKTHTDVPFLTYFHQLLCDSFSGNGTSEMEVNVHSFVPREPEIFHLKTLK